jgi:hypothetical protein
MLGEGDLDLPGPARASNRSVRIASRRRQDEVTVGGQMHDRIASLKLTEVADLCSTRHRAPRHEDRK